MTEATHEFYIKCFKPDELDDFSLLLEMALVKLLNDSVSENEQMVAVKE